MATLYTKQYKRNYVSNVFYSRLSYYWYGTYFPAGGTKVITLYREDIKALWPNSDDIISSVDITFQNATGSNWTGARAYFTVFEEDNMFHIGVTNQEPTPANWASSRWKLISITITFFDKISSISGFGGYAGISNSILTLTSNYNVSDSHSSWVFLKNTNYIVNLIEKPNPNLYKFFNWNQLNIDNRYDKNLYPIYKNGDTNEYYFYNGEKLRDLKNASSDTQWALLMAYYELFLEDNLSYLKFVDLEKTDISLNKFGLSPEYDTTTNKVYNTSYGVDNKALRGFSGGNIINITDKWKIANKDYLHLSYLPNIEKWEFLGVQNSIPTYEESVDYIYFFIQVDPYKMKDNGSTSSGTTTTIKLKWQSDVSYYLGYSNTNKIQVPGTTYLNNAFLSNREISREISNEITSPGYRDWFWQDYKYAHWLLNIKWNFSFEGSSYFNNLINIEESTDKYEFITQSAYQEMGETKITDYKVYAPLNGVNAWWFATQKSGGATEICARNNTNHAILSNLSGTSGSASNFHYAYLSNAIKFTNFNYYIGTDTYYTTDTITNDSLNYAYTQLSIQDLNDTTMLHNKTWYNKTTGYHKWANYSSTFQLSNYLQNSTNSNYKPYYVLTGEEKVAKTSGDDYANGVTTIFIPIMDFNKQSFNKIQYLIYKIPYR